MTERMDSSEKELQKLAVAIVGCGLYTADSLRKGQFKDYVSEDQPKKYLLVIFESLFLYIHLAARIVQTNAGVEKGHAVFDYLTREVVIKLARDEYGLSEKQISTLIDLEAEADIQYGKCSTVTPTKNEGGSLNIKTSCAHQLAERIAKPYDGAMTVFLTAELDFTIETYLESTELQKLALSVAKELR